MINIFWVFPLLIRGALSTLVFAKKKQRAAAAIANTKHKKNWSMYYPSKVIENHQTLVRSDESGSIKKVLS